MGGGSQVAEGPLPDAMATQQGMGPFAAALQGTSSGAAGLPAALEVATPSSTASAEAVTVPMPQALAPMLAGSAQPASLLPAPEHSYMRAPVDRAQTALLDEHGYQDIATSGDSPAMAVFVRRLIEQKHGRVLDEYELLNFAPVHCTTPQSFAALEKQLESLEWAGLVNTSAETIKRKDSVLAEPLQRLWEPKVATVVRESPLVVWITGYARSATSTVQSLVNMARAVTSERKVPPSGVFSLFEPCHPLDEVAPELSYPDGCDKLLSALAQCDFSKIDNLFEWQNAHNEGIPHNKWPSKAPAFDKDLARGLCGAADVRILKTITYGHRLDREVLPMLADHPEFRVIDVVRDPRGIFASWKTSDTFKDLVKGQNRTLMHDTCEGFAADADVQHPRLMRLRFEDLVSQPEKVMQEVMDFLGFHMGIVQKQWVAKTFNADCKHEGMFLDCHKDSQASAEKWRSELDQEEQASFTADPTCQIMAQKFGYSLQ